MVSSPARIAGNRVGKPATKLVKPNKDLIIHLLNRGGRSAHLLVVELHLTGLDHVYHILGDNGIVRVAVDLASKQKLYERICEANTHCVDEYVARHPQL